VISTFFIFMLTRLTDFAEIDAVPRNPKAPRNTSQSAGVLMAIGPSPSQKPTPNQVLNFVINAVAFCSGFSASAITKDWVLGDPATDANGDKHPGAGLSQDGIDICLTQKLNQFIVHFGSSNTIGAGTYTPTSKVSEVAADVSSRI
jgi:hypothetical protein